MKNTITRIILTVFALLSLVACNWLDIDHQSGKTTSSELKGIWKMVSVRCEGGNLSNVGTVYAIIDPDINEIALFSIESKISQGPCMGTFGFTADGGQMTLFENNEEMAGFPYELFDGSDLHLFPDAISFLSEEMLSQEPSAASLHIEFLRDADLEALVGVTTKADGDSWMANAVQVLEEKAMTSVGDDGIDAEKDFVTSETWPNSKDWKASEWMSKLPNDMPVAWVNIPGSHDSSTSKDKMNFIADNVDAWVQTYSIMDQFDKGARYFDFRVGSELVSCWLGLGRRAMDQSERNAVKELQMYHGPLCTNTPFIGSMEELAQRIIKGGTEFVIINVQAEGESDGLWSSLNLEIQEWLFDDDDKSKMYAAAREQSMDIANRLMKEFSRKYNDEIFIPYTPDLTVGQARGHIIILQDDKNMRYQCRQFYYDLDGKLHDSEWLKATFIEGWPDNKKGYATFYTYNKPDYLVNDAYVQSYYEMKLNDKSKITTKENAIRSLATDVTSYNMDKYHTNIFGFNAMNANTGTATSLKTYAFAHEFNGFAYEMFVENMKNAGSSAQRFHCGVVPMDHYGADVFSNNKKVKLYGDKLSWAVIESNFYD